MISPREAKGSYSHDEKLEERRCHASACAGSVPLHDSLPGPSGMRGLAGRPDGSGADPLVAAGSGAARGRAGGGRAGGAAVAAGGSLAAGRDMGRRRRGVPVAGADDPVAACLVPPLRRIHAGRPEADCRGGCRLAAEFRRGLVGPGDGVGPRRRGGAGVPGAGRAPPVSVGAPRSGGGGGPAAHRELRSSRQHREHALAALLRGALRPALETGDTRRSSDRRPGRRRGRRIGAVGARAAARCGAGGLGPAPAHVRNGDRIRGGRRGAAHGDVQ